MPFSPMGWIPPPKVSRLPPWHATAARTAPETFDYRQMSAAVQSHSARAALELSTAICWSTAWPSGNMERLQYESSATDRGECCAYPRFGREGNASVEVGRRVQAQDPVCSSRAI